MRCVGGTDSWQSAALCVRSYAAHAFIAYTTGLVRGCIRSCVYIPRTKRNARTFGSEAESEGDIKSGLSGTRNARSLISCFEYNGTKRSPAKIVSIFG